MSVYAHELQSSYNMRHDKELIAKIIDERTAILEDGTRLRVTPEGQKTVADLLAVDNIIETSYGRENYSNHPQWGKARQHKVISLSKHEYYGLSTYSIIIVDPEIEPNQYGEYRESDEGYINEMVAQDNRILMLFESNKDEIFVVKKHSLAGQQSLFGGSARKYPLRPIETRPAIIKVRKVDKKDKGFTVDYDCRGCEGSCGGGYYEADLAKIDKAIESDKARLNSCHTLKEKRRVLKIQMVDERCKKL
jgi:hypothetical protein